MRVLDVWFCIPFTPLAMLLVTMLGKSAGSLVLAVSIANTLSFAKTTRGCVLSITQQDYIKAARLSGAPPLSIVTGHILPNTFTYPYGEIGDGAEEIIRDLGFEASLGCTEKMNWFSQSSGTEELYGLGRFLRPNDMSSEAFFTKNNIL